MLRSIFVRAQSIVDMPGEECRVNNNRNKSSNDDLDTQNRGKQQQDDPQRRPTSPYTSKQSCTQSSLGYLAVTEY